MLRAMKPWMLAPAALFLLFLSLPGPFLNEDYEKVRKNENYLRQGPLWQKAFEHEAGYERSYFRPVNNVLLAGMVRTFGTSSALPYRLLAFLCLFLAAASVYFLARRTGLGADAAGVLALFFALHPFNSWNYFQSSWAGNSLSLVLMAVAFFVYDRGAKEDSRILPRTIALFFLVYAAGLCKDSGVLIVVLLAPLAFFQNDRPWPRRAALLAAALSGALLFCVHRSVVLSGDPLSPVDPAYAISHAGWLWVNYLAVLLSASNFNYARSLPPGPGWLLTALFVVFFFAVLWALRRDRKKAFLWWCVGVLALESVIASFRGYWLFPTRAVLWIAAWLLFIGATRPKKIFVMVFLAWFALPSVLHLWTARDERTFYAYHNRRPYGWKLLYVEGQRHLEDEEWVGAEKCFRESLVFYKNTKTYDALARSVAKQGRRLEALESWVGALTLNPWHLPSLEHLVGALAELPLDGAVWERLDRLEAKALVLSNLGVLFAQKSDRSRALAMFDAALEADPSYEPARHNRAIILG
jgi:tetratricopeptide (TPR) repeat protein